MVHRFQIAAIQSKKVSTLLEIRMRSIKAVSMDMDRPTNQGNSGAHKSLANNSIMGANSFLCVNFGVE